MTEEAKLIPADELTQHTTEDNLWLAIGGNVYAIPAEFLEDHPGGPDVLLAEAGKDATSAFDDIGHSDTARDLLEPMLIGTLDTTSVRIVFLFALAAARRNWMVVLNFLLCAQFRVQSSGASQFLINVLLKRTSHPIPLKSSAARSLTFWICQQSPPHDDSRGDVFGKCWIPVLPRTPVAASVKEDISYHTKFAKEFTHTSSLMCPHVLHSHLNSHRSVRLPVPPPPSFFSSSHMWAQGKIQDFTLCTSLAFRGLVI